MKVILTILVICVCSVMLARGDSIKIDSGQRTKDFYDSLKVKSYRKGKLSKFIVGNILREPRQDGVMYDEGAVFQPFNGMVIGEITINTNDIFADTTSWLTRFMDDVHVVTRERVVRYDLLFKTGDRVNPDVIMRSIQILRSRDYIYDAVITLVPTSDGVVNVVVSTQDSWTIGASLRLSGVKTSIKLYDANFLGYGNRLQLNTNIKWGDSYGGNSVIMDIPNILGTFFSGKVNIGKEFEFSNALFNINKEFVLPNDIMLGAEYNRGSRPTYLIAQDTSVKVKGEYLKVWGGVSRSISKKSDVLYLVGSYEGKTFLRRPDVTSVLNSAFEDKNLMLLGMGFYREKLLSTSLIYGYGIKEFLPKGYRLEAKAGYNWGEFYNTPYIGMEFGAGFQLSSGSHLISDVELGSYYYRRDFLRSALNVNVNYFAPIYRLGSSRLRHVLALDHMQGWNRLEGNDEMLTFNGGLSYPRSFREYVSGTNRTVLNTETIIFTNLAPLDFRFAFFFFADFGLIGFDTNTFRNDFFTTLGVGTRIKNEHLIFGAIQFTFGICLGKGGIYKNQLFRTSSIARVDNFTFKPSYPQPIYYK